MTSHHNRAMCSFGRHVVVVDSYRLSSSSPRRATIFGTSATIFGTLLRAVIRLELKNDTGAYRRRGTSFRARVSATPRVFTNVAHNSERIGFFFSGEASDAEPRISFTRQFAGLGIAAGIGNVRENGSVVLRPCKQQSRFVAAKSPAVRHRSRRRVVAEEPAELNVSLDWPR